MKRNRYTDENGMTRHRVEITVADIRKRFNLPEDAEVVLTVPGGADWSGMTLPLEEFDGPIKAKWERS